MKITVGLVQVNWGLEWQHAEGHKGVESVCYSFLPYSVGLLQAYAAHYLPETVEVEWLPQVFARLDSVQAADLLDGADVVAFSAYIWNMELSLAIARILKKRNPQVLIVFGGPQVPDRSEEFLRTNRCVDLACHGEGEAVFTAVLEQFASRDWSEIPAVSYLDGDEFITHPKAGRTKELSEIPSPYLSGVFDSIIQMNPEERWVLTWETNRGCPFSCTFCDWGSATASRVYSFDMERLESELSWLVDHKVGSIVCCDANFGMLPRDIEIIEKVIASRHSTGYPYTISVQNAKNSTERSYKIQKLLSDNMHTTGVTLSLQTTNQNTLKNIRRANIRSESFRELQRRFARDGIYTYTDVIIGLPGETYVEFADSIAQVIADGQHNHIQFHNCSILPNAEMGDPEYIKKFGMVTAPLPIRAVYAPADEEPEYEEFLDTVVATDAMPPQQWVQAKTFAWMTDLLYFDRLLQIPLLVTHERLGVSHRLLMESITEADEEQFPTLGWARRLLRTQAALIQDGTLEFFKGSSGGNLLWPGDQYLYIEMVSEGRLDQFYQEAEKSLMEFTKLASDPLEESIIIQEAFSLNKALLCLPDQDRDVSVVLSHDILSYWRGVSEGETPELTETMASYRINRAARTWSSIEDWAEFLIWCQGRDKREYLYEITQSRRALAS